ncbi:MAG TPA: hypothetical protein VKE74_25735, partial [Gemmataceae bacterium]|nr:hypothetical protein [Gemmataceae bacterium]
MTPEPIPPPHPVPTPPPAPPTPPPGRRPPPPRQRRFGCLFPLTLVLLFLSLFANLVLAFFLFADWADLLDTDRSSLTERVILGDKNARDKVAVIRIEGVIYDSSIVYPIRQLEKAAKDTRVKAVVLRIDSPGGTVTASEELYQNVVNLRDNNDRRFQGTGPKPVSVSMGGLCAS